MDKPVQTVNSTGVVWIKLVADEFLRFLADDDGAVNILSEEQPDLGRVVVVTPVCEGRLVPVVNGWSVVGLVSDAELACAGDLLRVGGLPLWRVHLGDCILMRNGVPLR